MTHAREPFDGLPERVGPYRRLRQLGAGGMGAVFEVEHEETGARYALKVILPEALGVEGLARFRQEAEAMARLDHRHLAKIHTARLEPPLFFLVLDLYPGGTLEARLADGPLPVAEATSIAARVADGVAHAHAHGVLHRDIKPENVLFDDRGQPVLADFGLSRGDSAERMTQTGDLLGSPTTMAPEQVTDAKGVGPPADVYGLGALLYRMLTGEPPIPTAATVVGTLARVLEHAPRAPHELRPEVSPALSALCLRALSKQPELRPSARELGDALAGRSVAPGRARHARWLAGAGSLAALAVSGVAVVWVGPRGGASEPPRGPAPEAPSEVARAQLPRWVESLDGRHVALT
ncbi:MAG: serine/threonine protein kinase, partial [Planctomycetes bacterium]|nr:serine/threonine protein kinase [Planctomycetota bacterium]